VVDARLLLDDGSIDPAELVVSLRLYHPAKLGEGSHDDVMRICQIPEVSKVVGVEFIDGNGSN
jgi:hypothetical protein